MLDNVGLAQHPQRLYACAPFQAMGSIFAGLVQVGAWGCFDEFNRINIEVLSVVSAQLKAIQNSLISGKPTVDIGVGGEIKIKRVAGFATCGVFITMNPGYAGRTELPDNLKALFRPVTMIVPDLLQICEIMLFSEGFEAAKVRNICFLLAGSNTTALKCLCNSFIYFLSSKEQHWCCVPMDSPRLGPNFAHT